MIPGLHRPTRAIVSLSAIIHNYRTIKQSLPRRQAVIAVIKANAYGHGAVRLAQALSAETDGFAVALSDEALELREAGIANEIFILGLTSVDDAWLHAHNQIGVTFQSLDWLKAVYNKRLASNGKRLKLHLKVDSGMGRIGARSHEEAQKIIDYVANHQDLFELNGIFTHFATADGISGHEKVKVRAQLDAFAEITDNLKVDHLHVKPILHQSNSALALWYPEETLDAVRLGIALYGVNPSNGENPLPLDLQPALSLESTIISVKKMHAGDTVSYGATYTAEEDEWIATLPIGYADGWSRRLVGLDTIVEGQRCPTVGRICMDQTMIHLPYEVAVGTKVTLIGENRGEKITAEEVGAYEDTIGYEVLCAISDRVPREYIN